MSSKRKRSLAEYEWGLDDADDFMSSRPTKRAAINEDDDGEEEEEEETMHMDEEVTPQQQQSQQQKGMAVLNSMPVKGNGRAAKAVEDDVPCVCLDEHYNTHYNAWVKARFSRCQGQYESEEEDEEDEEEDDDDDNKERGECFLCSWGNRFHDGVKAKHVNVLHGILDNYGACDNLELARQLHLYYKEKVYRKERGMSMLTTKIALQHIVGMHSLSATFFLGESIKAWKEAWFCFKNITFKANGKFDKEAFNNWKECQKMLCILYKMDVKSMNFNYGKSREDISKLGVPFFMMPEMKQVRDKDKRATKTKKLLAAGTKFSRGTEI